MKQEEPEFYADGIGQIQFAAGMIRYNFVSLVPENDGKTLSARSRVRLVMPPQGFLNTFNSMQQLIEKLLEAGVLKRGSAVETAEVPAVKEAPVKASKKSKKAK